MPSAKSPKRVARKAAGAASRKKPVRRSATRGKAPEGAVAARSKPADGATPDRTASATQAGRPAARRAKQTSGPTITIEQYVSGIACPVRHKRVLRSLGLRHPWHRVVRPDNPAVRGMVKAIPHLVRIIVEDTRRGA